MQDLSTFIDLNRPIIITGNSGVGKSFLAKEIFSRSQINKKSFLTLHLASIKEDLIESEIFGHVRGAFTGAIENKLGYLQKAQGGTLFIDEIGDLSLEGQKKLLYLLEEKMFVPVGDTQSIKFNGRIILATNKNLKKEVEEGRFREDLFFRIMVFQIHVPNISQDKEFLKKLIKLEFKKAKLEFSRHDLKISDLILEKLVNYSWPGNRRELKNLMEFSVVNCQGQEITEKNFPKWFDHNFETSSSDLDESNYWRAVENFESKYLKHILEKNQGRINDTSKLIGLSKRALIYKARKYKINTNLIRATQPIENTENLAA